MRRSGRKITASLLAVLMIASSAFSNVTVAHATEVAPEAIVAEVAESTNTAVTEIEEVTVPETAVATEVETAAEGKTEEKSTVETKEETSSEKVSEEVSSEAEELKISSIADARTAETGTEIAVKGIITFIDGKNIYLQDDTAGIDAYYATKPTDLKLGDELTVKGKYKVFNGLIELDGAETIEVNHVDAKLPVKEVTVKELLDDYAADGKYEATRVLIKNVTIGKINTSSNTVLTADDESTINVYKIPALDGVNEGAKVNVIAVVSDYKAIQLRVANAADVTVVENGGEEKEEPAEEYMSIADAKKAEIGTADLTVKGMVVFIDGKNVYVQDKTGGIDAYFSTLPDGIAIGDTIVVKGKRAAYNGLQELSGAELIETVSKDGKMDATVVTIKELLDDYAADGNYECTKVLIKNVTIGAIKTTSNTVLTDDEGNKINIYKIPALSDVTEGAKVNVTAVVGDFKAIQLRVVKAEDVKVVSGNSKYEIDNSVTLNVAKFAGTADIGDKTVVNADLYAENDMLDETTTFAAYKSGKQIVPLIKNSTKDATTGVTTYTYSLGSSSGLAKDDYFIIKTDASQFGNIEMSFRTRGSKTAARNFVVEYSVDGEKFAAAGDTRLVASYFDYSTNEDVKIDTTAKNGEYYIAKDGKFQTVTVSLPEEANAAKELYIKVKVKDDTRVDGKDVAISSGATTYMNSIVITGNPIVSEDMVGYVSVSPKAGAVAQGQELTFTTNTKDAKILYRFDTDSEFKTYSADSKPVIKNLPCLVTVYATKAGLTDSIKTTYSFEQMVVETVKINPNGGSVNLGAKVKLSCETEGAKIYYAVEETTETESETHDWVEYTEAIVLKTLPCTLYTKAELEGCQSSAVKSAKFTKRENEKYGIYFGQMHSHTNYSDGAGSAQDAFEHAKNTPNLDFLFITDHSNSYDNCDNANINDGSVSTEWNEGHDLAKQYTTDKFVAAMGYEMTWSNGLGHMNTFNSNGFQSRTQADYKTYGTALNNYYKALQTAPDTISQFNHPGTTFGDFQDFAYFSSTNDGLISLIEVGNGEGAIGSSGYFPSYEYYQRALDKGWHVAPTNNQDNHKGLWGSANTARSVVLADSLTEDSIYDAMRNNRVYATEDNDLSIYYTLDDYIMGSVLTKDMCGDKVTLKVELSDPTDSAIGTVQVIANGGIVVASKKVTTNKETVEFEVDNKYSFYYIKVVEADKDIAVTAPVWVGEVEAVGINAITTDTTLPIKGEALDVTLDLYNNEKVDLEINSIEFSVGGKVVENVDLEKANLTKVASEKTATYTFSYTHNAVGAMEMEVVVKATLNGVEKIYNDKLALTYVSNDLVAHVVIDGSHYNDYVKGYYGGNMGNFIKMAAEKNVKAEIVTEKFTKDTLKDADLLIVSAPAKKTGTANAGDYVPSSYEDEFLEIVKEYVQNGGSVIVCGLADYQDSTNGQTATQTNKLLEAIGATIRMNSDEAYDEVNNGGQAYRLYYQNFNMSDKWMSGVVEKQQYSAYSGCTVNITNATANDTVEEAVALVKGFDTTYSIDCKKDDGSASDSSVYVEKGKVVALAYQNTKFGGAIFVGGSVFMSDFEVKASLDNNDDLQYANYTIINNILESKKVVMKATPIAEVRKANMGDVFAIEGYVANGTDNENTKFFDTIYVEDETAGITVFPFATAGVKNGTKIRLVGYVDAYQGDKELQIVSYEILDDVNLKTIVPTELSVKDSMDYENHGGSLVKVTGKVSRVQLDNGVVSEFWLTDGNGNEAAIFIDGYITSATTGKNTIADFVKEGSYVEACGFLYKHPEGASDVSVPVLRVANCDTITEVVDPEKIEALRKAKEELEAATAELEAAKEVLAIANAQVVTDEEAVATAKAKLDAANKAYAEASDAVSKAEEAVAAAKAAKKTADKHLSDANNELLFNSAKLSVFEATAKTVEKLAKQAQNTADAAKKSAQKASFLTKGIKNAIANAAQRVADSLYENLANIKKNIEAAKADIEHSEKYVSDSKQEVEYANANLANANSELETAKNAQKSSKADIESSEKSLKEAQNALEVSKKEAEEANANVVALEEKIKELEELIKSLS